MFPDRIDAGRQRDEHGQPIGTPLAADDLRVGSDMMKHVAPLGREHLSLTGNYAWDTADLPGPGELRLLRNKPSLLAA